uniref:ferroxidase n=1 Tax=Cyprinus carpio TaxID=7962 RepID=A0A8C2L711_CYPCA
MKLCSWPGAPYGLAILAFLCNCATAVERRYYIAAVNINWDYTSAGQQRTGPSYKKVVYREYNEGFTQAKTHPLSSGLLGPTLRGQEGDTIIVTFKNMADHPCSLHPHGIAYGKQSEGSLYFDNTSLCEKEDDVILPGKEHTYQWEVTSEVTPTAADPPCITYTYLSHFDIVKDYNTGLIGPMLICKKGSLDDSGNQLHFHQEAVLLFGVFDENKSWYTTGGPEQPHKVKYTINGYTNGSVPDLDICAHSKVSWHLLGMSSEPELFSVHFNGQALVHDGHKTSSVGIISGTATSASMNGIHPGRWLISSHISRHLEAGLHGYFNIKTCDEYTAPKRRLTIQQKQESQVWTYYIAAEEVIWDYAPNMPENMDGDFRSKYLKQGPQRIGKKYKKAVFTQYKDGTFKERAEDKQRKKELGILGPVIRAQIRDIVFKNKATRPYSIYPHGLTIDKAAEGANYPNMCLNKIAVHLKGNQTHGIQPGENYTYTWSVSEEDTPTDSDPRCLTRMYHSAVDTPRDIASGLVGPLLICKSQSLNKKNVQLKADKEQHAMFTVFDENKSWYHDENINTYCSDPRRVKRDDPEFYKSNVMHTINGYVYESGQELGFCNGEIVTWHVSSVGEQDYIQTATFYGHTFELKNREEDMLSLFPMTADVQSPALDVTSQHFLKMAGDKNTRTFFISVEEEEWDYAGLINHLKTRGPLSETSEGKWMNTWEFWVRSLKLKLIRLLWNLASRPYSLHANGVKYLKQMEGLSYDDQSPYWYKQDDAVQPNSTFIYMWTINSKSGPQNNESDCRTWTYYSAVNPERDINSGLIGPLLVCRKGTLDQKPLGRREFVLLFMTFDESKSWYYEENRERIERKNKRAVMDPNFKNNLKFDAINGIIYSLKGLRMYTNQLAKWHLINMGSPKDLHSVHFHGQTFINKELKDHRQGVYPLLPGGFATLEMLPSKPGLWQLESEVGLSQQRGMQTLFLVLDNGIIYSNLSFRVTLLTHLKLFLRTMVSSFGQTT